MRFNEVKSLNVNSNVEKYMWNLMRASLQCVLLMQPWILREGANTVVFWFIFGMSII